MRAVVCHDGILELDDVAQRLPGRGQVLLNVSYCGICGSDLHARRYADRQADVLAEAGYTSAMRSNQRVIMGHEFCGTVAGYGPGTKRKVALGAVVVALPVLRSAAGLDAVGISANAPGAYAEQVIVQESLMLPVPNGLTPDLAALTEPVAIGWHAVRRSEIKKNDVAIVIGCGPVGLAIIATLKAKGVRTVVASDLSTGRGDLARACGADVVVDPAEASPSHAAKDPGYLRTIPAAVELGVATTEKLQRLPLPWHHVWRAAEALGVRAKRPVVFECVGARGIIDQIVGDAPLYSRVVVVGVCMVPDTFRPVMAVNKEVDLRFVVGYTPLEFRDTLHMLADGEIETAAMFTGTVGLAGVAAVFDTLASPNPHAKILIDPSDASAGLTRRPPRS